MIVVGILLSHSARKSLAIEIALLHSAEKGQVATAERFLDDRADNEPFNHFGRTPLILAAHRGKDETVNILLDRGAKLEAWDSFQATGLNFAARLGHATTS